MLSRDPSPGPAGVAPYEMAGTKEERPALADFDDATQWKVEGSNAEGWLYRSNERKLFRDHVGKLVYVARGEKPVINLLLREPITIPEPWDTFTFWNYGNNWGYTIDPKTPQLGVVVMLRDSAGQALSLWPGSIDYEYWFLMASRLQPEIRAKYKPPFKLVGFQFNNGTNTEKRAVWLGPCYTYQEENRPLKFEPWPEKLPFPTREETILPTNKTAGFRNEVSIEDETVVFRYKGSDADLSYRYRPTTGTLSDIELEYGGKVIHPCMGGGVQLAGPGGVIAPDDPKIRYTLKDKKLEGSRFTVTWRLVCEGLATDVTYAIQIKQKSLIVDIAASEPIVERVALGRVEPVREPKLFKVPYITFAYGDLNVDPRVLYSDGLFLFTQFDWYRSDASKLIGGGEQKDDWAVCNRCAQYIPKTDGTRNPVRERLFINVSPDFQEVLPTIPNPPSPYREVMGDRVWRVKYGADHAAEIAEAAGLRSYGCEKVAVRYHEDSWRDAGESFTFRLSAGPARGGDAALRKMVDAVRGLGWLVGLYTNYTDFAPVNSFWSPDHACREPNAQWQRAWMRCYSAKPMWAVEMEAKLAPQIHAKFNTNHSYCDVHTAIPPWERNDYDARVPGAAMFRRVYECYGRILYNEKIAHAGPVYSEGLHHWWYAGLTDGNYAQIVSKLPSKEPLLVDFDLLKIHPLEMDAGMGAAGMYFKAEKADLDQFIAATLAYGHIGYLEWSSMEGTLKIYYMVRPVQTGYVMEPVQAIEYEHDGRMLGTSEALVSGAYRDNRVHVAYENGTQVYVNGSDSPWAVDLPLPWGRWELPRWGWAVWTKDAMSVSAIPPATVSSSSQRVDLCVAPASYYVNSRGGVATLPNGLSVEGSAVLRKEGADWYLQPTDKCRDFAFPPGLVGLDETSGVAVVGLNADGTEAGSAPTRLSQGRLHVLPGDKPALRYRIQAGAASRPATNPTGRSKP